MQKNWRECDSCGIKMAAYEPRRKVGDSFLCPDCAKKAKVEMTARKKTATWSQARHPRPLIHTPGRKPPRPLQTGDSLLWEDGSADPIVGHSESLLMTPSGIKHRGPIEGDYSNTIVGIDADDKADMDSIGSPEAEEFLRTNPTGPSKYSVRKVAHDSGDGMSIYHCPFCGSGQVIARSDGTVECQFCHNAFTVQVQPQYPAFPQTIDGMPVQVPGMPGQIGGPSSPMDPGMLGPDGEMPGEEEGPAEGAEDAEEAPPGEEDEGGDDAPPWAKKSYRTPAGHVLPGDEFIRHVAIHTSSDRLLTARAIRETRRP